ncbi:MAG TPA: PBP1A family penicillin-binding protein [Candidatus Deferrimicrobiaceae bacterium]|nr:PBP1A family penicillin-binding protein [Candidatus Deferrimicrobiaceae bacterium]
MVERGGGRFRGRRRFTLFAGGLLAILVLGAGGLAIYAAAALSRFERVEARRSTVLYAAPPVLRPGVHVGALDLAGILSRVGYRETRGASGPGQFSRSDSGWEIHVAGPAAGRVTLAVSGGRITGLRQGDAEVQSVALPPELLASAGADMGENIRPVRLPDVPAVLRNAVLATEDVRFYEHGGVDPRGILRALWTNIRKGRVAEGGSTITQQLVKSRLLNPERTLARKVNEALLSTVLEWRYSKDQILEAYLNEIYLGQWGGSAVRGVGAASRAYFGKEVHQVTLAEAALLAGMIRAPNSYSPVSNPERARERRDVVLSRLRDLGRISEADYRRARKEPVRARVTPTNGLVAPYFIDYVRAELERNPDLELAGQHGVRVYTTLDPVLQRLAEAAVVKGMDRLETARPRLRRKGPEERLQAAMVVLDPATGQVRALVGGRDYRSSQFNRAVQARRQPGSAFKPFVYLTALTPRKDATLFTAASLIEDAPITIMMDGKPWTPKNYDDRYEGTVTVRRALEGSLNTATVRLAQAVGLPAVIDTARGLGMEADLKPVPALTLGVFEITPLQLARAYLPLVNGGLAPAGGAVEAVADDGGRALWSAGREARPVIGAPEAYLVTSLLEGVINAGTGASARVAGVPGAVAGKTGTTNDGRDAWFVGYAPNLLALVWVGFDDGVAAGLSGSEGALPIWSEFMRQALEVYPGGAFPEPAGITRAKVDVTTGRRATAFCPLVATEVFLSGTEPPPCEEHGGVTEQIERWWDRVWDWFRK